MIWAHHLSGDARQNIRTGSASVLPMLMGHAKPEGSPCDLEAGDEHAQHFCKTLELKQQEMNCHADRPCLNPPCGPGPLPISWPFKFRAEYYSPSKETDGIYALGVDSDGERAGLITMADGTLDHLGAYFHTGIEYQMIMTRGWRWLVWPQVRQCCRCCSFQLGCGPVDGTWLQNATGHTTYKGTDELPFGSKNVTCKKWDYEGFGGYNYYFEHLANDGERPLPCAIRGINYMFDESEPSDDYYVFNQSTFSTDVQPSLFDLPSYCDTSVRCSHYQELPCGDEPDLTETIEMYL